MLYRTAIQTGLRLNELRSLTRGPLFLDADSPYIMCKARSTKNQKDARQNIQPDLAADLKAHVARKAPKTPLFNLPQWSNPAQMLREDLAEARAAWIKQAKGDPQEYSRREESDFLAATNNEGESIDFHSLRHTCVAWLAMTGAHPKVVQQVMRHSSITLTMDTYGHLFPGQEVEAVGRLESIMSSVPEKLAATGTEDATLSERSAGRSSWDTNRYVDHTAPYDGDAKLATMELAENPSNLAAIYDPAPSATMPYDNSAPLAQLAEQLTLNQ